MLNFKKEFKSDILAWTYEEETHEALMAEVGG
jgi:hypothetical protein